MKVKSGREAGAQRLVASGQPAVACAVRGLRPRPTGSQVTLRPGVAGRAPGRRSGSSYSRFQPARQFAPGVVGAALREDNNRVKSDARYARASYPNR